MITIPLDSQSKRSLYMQIYESIKSDILAGHLAHPEKLPSSRSLAANLQVSRSTVDTAYGQLVAEGYITSVEKRGYFVNPVTYAQTFTAAGTKSATPSPIVREDENPRYDFNPDAIDTTHFPYSIWKSIGKNQLDNPDNFLMGGHFGNQGLRQAIAGYLYGSRGVNCTPDNIVVGAGLDHLLQMLCVLFAREPIIAMEDPGYRSARQVLISSGYRVLDVPLAEGAFDVDALRRTDADICYVTPSHQFPLGSVLSISRRQSLLAWAAGRDDRYIIEDDHDSEFRYRGRPIPALQSLDHGQKVIYIGTFSKAISPAIRTGYMVLPPSLMARYRQKCGSYACPVSRIDQAILTEFIQKGYFEKHLNRMRKIYKGKHDYMMEQFALHFPDGRILGGSHDHATPGSSHNRAARGGASLEISGDNAGLYLILHYHGTMTETEILGRAKKFGIRLRPLKEYYANPPANYLPAFLIGFANLDEKQIREGISLLAGKVFV